MPNVPRGRFCSFVLPEPHIYRHRPWSKPLQDSVIFFDEMSNVNRAKSLKTKPVHYLDHSRTERHRSVVVGKDVMYGDTFRPGNVHILPQATLSQSLRG